MADLLTIGMPSYNNPVEVWATVTALKMYHDLEDTEIIVIDNVGNDTVKKIAKDTRVKYYTYTEKVGPQMAKNYLFDMAKNSFVLCIDSHVMLWPNAVKYLKQWVKTNYEEAKNLIQGPMAYVRMDRFSDEWKNKWRGNMWGVWGKTLKELPTETREIEMMGTGLFGCRRDSWLGFHPENTGFGGAEGCIHEKYRQAGRKTLSLPWLVWCHNFNKEDVSYPLDIKDRVRNYLRSFDELNLDPEPIYGHFGKTFVKGIENGMSV